MYDYTAHYPYTYALEINLPFDDKFTKCFIWLTDYKACGLFTIQIFAVWNRVLKHHGAITFRIVRKNLKE